MRDGSVLGAMLAGAHTLGELAAAPWPPAADADLLALLHTWAVRMAAWRGTPAAPAAADRPRTLTERELTMLTRVAAGQSNKLIARALGLSPHTVKRHIANIFDKLGLSTRAQAAVWLKTRS